MPAKDPRVDAYIARAAPFARAILQHLRKLVHAGCPEITETIKWQRPHFDYRGPICGMSEFKEYCSFGFWKAVLLLPKGAKVAGGGAGDFGKIKTLADLPNDKAMIGYVRKAAELNQAGVKVPASKATPRKAPAMPRELTAALAKNARAKATFDRFSPSQRREYIEWIAEAKRPETRVRRLATALGWLEEGKARNWKYMPAKSTR